MSGEQSGSKTFPHFATTLWSVVLAVAEGDTPEALVAMEKLCRAYWYPLYAFVRCKGRSPEDAQDLVQAFFEQLLEKESLRRVERGHGKFRSFLLACLRNFLASEWHKSQACKRGGGCQFIPWNDSNPEEYYQREWWDGGTPDALYEKAWAQTLLDRVRARWREKHLQNADPERFRFLESVLFDENVGQTQVQVANRLGVNESTVYSEMHRLKKSFRSLLRAEIAHTVANPSQIDEELRALISAVRDGRK